MSVAENNLTNSISVYIVSLWTYKKVEGFNSPSDHNHS